MSRITGAKYTKLKIAFLSQSPRLGYDTGAVEMLLMPRSIISKREEKTYNGNMPRRQGTTGTTLNKHFHHKRNHVEPPTILHGQPAPTTLKNRPGRAYATVWRMLAGVRAHEKNKTERTLLTASKLKVKF